MTLGNLVGRTLESVEPDASAIARLLDAAKSSLADAKLPGISNEGRFDMAYKAIMQCANAALHANGFRTLTSKPGHHQTMIQTLTSTIGLDASTMLLLDRLRKQRNVIDYSGDVVSLSMANQAVVHAETLLLHTGTWIRANKPDLFP